MNPDSTFKHIFAQTIDDSLFALLEKCLISYASKGSLSNSKETVNILSENLPFIEKFADKYSNQSCKCFIKNKEELICAIESFLSKTNLIKIEASSNSSKILETERNELYSGSSESVLLKIDNFENSLRSKKHDPVKISAVIDRNLKLLNKLQENVVEGEFLSN